MRLFPWSILPCSSFSLRIWWTFWMLTAQSALSCCFSPPGASSQPVWHLTSTPSLESFPACTSWHSMPHSTAGDCSCFLLLMYRISFSVKTHLAFKASAALATSVLIWEKCYRVFEANNKLTNYARQCREIKARCVYVCVQVNWNPQWVMAVLTRMWLVQRKSTFHLLN